MIDSRTDRVCVIGAGPTGLTAARAFLNQGVEVDILERHNNVGGIWDIENPGSPMYSSCSMITSRIAGGFVGYPMSDELAMYPKWSELRDYVRAFAHEFRLDDRCEFGVTVKHAEPVNVAGERPRWRVFLSSGEVRDYLGVFAAVGAQWDAHIPEIQGLDTFTGRAIHSKDYSGPEDFRGKKVLVVGAGNSGVDIASDAAFHADEAWLSTRRAYPFLPKQIFGNALPDVLDGRFTPPEGRPDLAEMDAAQVLDLVTATVGDLEAYGLPSAEGVVIGQTHPIVSNTILHAFSHGMISHRPDLARIDGDTVEFVDGRTTEPDVIVFATGYGVSYPFLDDGRVEYTRGHPKLHVATFVPGLEGFWAGGVIHAAVGQGWTLHDIYATLAACDAKAMLTGENAEAIQAVKENYDPDFTGGFPFTDVARNVTQADGYTALVTVPQEIEAKFGIHLPTGFDDAGFYAGVPRRSRERSTV